MTDLHQPTDEASNGELPPGVKLLRTLEGHTGGVEMVVSSPDGRLLVSKGEDTIHLWSSETWETIALIPARMNTTWLTPALAFHPTRPLLAAVGSKRDAPDEELDRLIHLWELDFDVLFGKRARASAAEDAVHHTTGKILLVGDHSVGESALGYRLIHGTFKEQASTHGQHFWVFPALGRRRADGTGADALPGVVRELPRPAQPDGDTKSG
jgi:WD40 repeat protein